MSVHSMPVFNTPDNWDELMKWIEQHPKQYRPSLITAAAMSWNLAAKLTTENNNEKHT